LVTITVSTPVAWLRIVTVAPGTAEPCSSVTTPLMTARSARCARAGLLEKVRDSSASRTWGSTKRGLVISTSGTAVETRFLHVDRANTAAFAVRSAAHANATQ
jgi:hypothetical protein